ncbi:MAG: TRAP transporter large permease subunit [Halofilum sp. (in: g-proteobacteria)]|nr:TRAP transporter large permease subunit [Halofilum sp. (in: g-proteobacteria)]
MEWLSLVLFLALIGLLLLGYPVAFTLGGVGLVAAGLGTLAGVFDTSMLIALPNRLYAIMINQTLIAVPLFVFMGVMLERCSVAESLLDTMTMLFGRLRGGMGISVTVVGMLLAASTGIVGATVVTMGLLSLPSMLRRGYEPSIATGTICASGTLGQIIPPSIVLVLLGDVIATANQQAQLMQGIFSGASVSVGDLFMGALIPGLLLVMAYLVYIGVMAVLRPDDMPPIPAEERRIGGWALAGRTVRDLIPPMALIVAVLGSILGGYATPTEAASVGAAGAMVLAIAARRLTLPVLVNVMRSTTRVTCMVFLILVGASIFSLVFRGFGGDEAVHTVLNNLPGGVVGAMIVVMLMMFLLGFVLDFIEITFVIVPIVGPILIAMGLDPVWLGIMIALNLQTSFLTPPFGFSLFYLRGVAPASVATGQIYRGVAPFIGIQLAMLVLLAFFPGLATWLPAIVYGN